ncbi:MAG: signal peptidase I, partial [Candidatus Izimaplasma sp.]|nr:signal peptidase I [Candidatus Izimaplasma bacterium]
ANVFFYGFIIFFVFYLVLEIFMPTKTIDYVGFKTFVVLTPSMEPDINVNDMIVIKKTSQENIDEGDAVTFKVYLDELDREVYITHYVAEIDDSGEETIYYTQGANAEEGVYDDWVDENNQDIDITYDDIVGKYLFRIPYLGLVTRMFNDPVMVGFIAFDILIIYYLYKLIRKPKKVDPDNEIDANKKG